MGKIEPKLVNIEIKLINPLITQAFSLSQEQEQQSWSLLTLVILQNCEKLTGTVIALLVATLWVSLLFWIELVRLVLKNDKLWRFWHEEWIDDADLHRIPKLVTTLQITS